MSRIFSLRLERISQRHKRIYPPSKTGIGSRFNTAKFMLINPIQDKASGTPIDHPVCKIRTIPTGPDSH